MTQRQIKQAPGTLPPCTQCTTWQRTVYPRHFVDLRGVHAGGGHFLECSLCGGRTARHPELARAVAQWIVQPVRMAPPQASVAPGNVRAIRR